MKKLTREEMQGILSSDVLPEDNTKKFVIVSMDCGASNLPYPGSNGMISFNVEELIMHTNNVYRYPGNCPYYTNDEGENIGGFEEAITYLKRGSK